MSSPAASCWGNEVTRRKPGLQRGAAFDFLQLTFASTLKTTLAASESVSFSFVPPFVARDRCAARVFRQD